VNDAHARSLVALGLGADPLSDPLTYPGRVPEESGLLIDDRFLRVTPASRAPLGSWSVEGADDPVRPLDALLAGHGQALVSERHPVVSIGSNAAPAQVHAKFTRARVRAVLPMIRSRVAGIRAGVSAHVSRAGYVPATPVVDSSAVSTLVVLWPDGAQLRALDRTEPNYRRAVLPGRFPVTLPSGELVAGPFCYVSRHGCIAGPNGSARTVRDQAGLIRELLADVPGLRAVGGGTPEEWISRMTDPGVRDRVRATLRAEGYVLDGEAGFAT
jgi:hypothetical protein